MFGKYTSIVLSIALLTCVSCMNEEDIFVVERDLAPEELVFGSELPEDELLSSMNIYVSEDLAVSLEEVTGNNGQVNLRPFKTLTQIGRAHV